MLPYGRQSIDQADIDAVTAALRSDWITQGPAIERFESAVASYCGAQYGVAVCNATAALHIACLALNLRSGDRLWTTPNTFLASANCGRYCGASVDFVDIDPHTYTMSVGALEAKLKLAVAADRLPAVVVPVHFAGQSCDMKGIRRLADRYGFRILEDAAHAIGGYYRDTPIGSCEYSDITVFSFHPVKIVTTGEGGMAITNDPQLLARLRRLRNHGVVREQELMSYPQHGAWYYEQLELGYNYRMTDMQAALGYSQLQRLDDFVARRRQLAQRYNVLLEALPLTTPAVAADCRSAWHLYVIQLDIENMSTDRATVFRRMRDQGIGVNVHYIPVHMQPYYQALGFTAGDYPVAEAYYSRCLSLPLFPAMTDSDQDKVVKCLTEALQ